MTGISDPTSIVLEHAGLTDHNLEKADHITAACACTCCSIWGTFWWVEEGGVERLVELRRKVLGSASAQSRFARFSLTGRLELPEMPTGSAAGTSLRPPPH